MIRIRSLFAIGLLAVLAPLTLSACGGGDDLGDLDPREVLTETFSNDEKVESGVIDITLSGSVEGEQAGNGEVSISGPFQGDAEEPASMPQFDLTGSISGEAQGTSVSFEGGMVVTEDNAFVEYQGNAYELGEDLFGQFRDIVEQASAQAQAGATGEEGATAAGFAQQCATLIEQAGGNSAACDTLDIWSWFELTNEGTEEIEGAETIHINGSVDVPAMIDNINATIAAAEIEGAEEITEEQRSQVEAAVSEITFDVYTGSEDRILRGLDLNAVIDPSAVEEGDQTVTGIDGNLSVRIGSVNEPQTITAPSDAQSLEELLSQFGLSSSDLEAVLGGYGTQFGLGGVGGTDPGAGLGTDPGAGAGGGAGGGGQASEEEVEQATEFFDCIAEAQTEADFERCNELAP